MRYRVTATPIMGVTPLIDPPCVMTINTERDYDAALGMLVRNAIEEARRLRYDIARPGASIVLKFEQVSS